MQNDFPVDKTNFLSLFPAATPVFPGVLFKQIDADDKDLNSVYSNPIHNGPKIILIYQKLKFMFSKKATKIDKIFTVDLTVTTYCQIDGEDFVNFCGLLRKCELYQIRNYLIFH